MADKRIIGFLVLVVLTSSIYIMLPGSVRLDVSETYSTFKVFEEGKWEISGTERTILMDGTKIMRASKRIVNSTVEGNLIKIYRYAYFKNGVIAKDTYEFRGDIKDIELFPIEHKIEIWNGKGYFFRYEVKDLIYSGETYKLNGETELKFGRNMKLEIHPDYRWGWVYKSGVVRIQYDINSNYEVFYNRLFDPKEKYLISDVKIENYKAKKIMFLNLNETISIKDEAEKDGKPAKDYFKLEKTKYFGDAKVFLKSYQNVTRERVKKTYNCNYKNETIWFIDNKTFENTSKIIETYDTCRIYENYTVSELTEINPETFKINKHTEIYEVFEGCTKIEELPNGKWGCSVETKTYILGIKIG